MTGRPLDEALLGAPVALTRDEVSALAGVPEPEARAFWVAMGFAEVPPGEPAFTVRDAEALRTALTLRGQGIDDATLLVLARSMGQGLSRLAEAQVQVLRGAAAGPATRDEAEAAVAASAGDVLPRLEALVVHVWRRQFAAAVERSLVSLGSDGAPVLAVGFVDLVGFTRTSRETDAAALEALLEAFERDTSLRVTRHGGRVVKTLGDAVLYVCDAVADAVDVALGVVAAAERDEGLPEVRAGVATGPVLQRLGDVFGTPVNLASRLTDEARPGTVLVDVAVAEALSDDPRYALQRLHRRPVRGFRALQPYRVRASDR